MVVKDKAIVFFGIGFELIGMMVGGFLLGLELDKYFGWKYSVPVLVILLLIAWFVHLIYLLQKFEKDVAKDEANSNTPQS